MNLFSKISKHYYVLSIFMLLFVFNYLLFKENYFFGKIVYLLVLILLLILYIGVTRLRLNYFYNSINSGIVKGISLTFDDGPNPEYTEKILDILKKKNVKASFFIIGKNIKGNENILKRIYSEGHLIGNHTFSHKYWFNSLPSSTIAKDIDKNTLSIEKIIGKKTKFYRTPFGLSSPNIARGIKKTNVISIGWDFRSFDTMAKNENELLNKLKKNVNTSSILLMHDNNKFTINVLEDFIDYCFTNGIKIVSLDKMVGINAYEKE